MYICFSPAHSGCFFQALLLGLAETGEDGEQTCGKYDGGEIQTTNSQRH